MGDIPLRFVPEDSLPAGIHFQDIAEDGRGRDMNDIQCSSSARAHSAPSLLERDDAPDGFDNIAEELRREPRSDDESQGAHSGNSRTNDDYRGIIRLQRTWSRLFGTRQKHSTSTDTERRSRGRRQKRKGRSHDDLHHTFNRNGSTNTNGSSLSVSTRMEFDPDDCSSIVACMEAAGRTVGREVREPEHFPLRSSSPSLKTSNKKMTGKERERSRGRSRSRSRSSKHKPESRSVKSGHGYYKYDDDGVDDVHRELNRTKSSNRQRIEGSRRMAERDTDRQSPSSSTSSPLSSFLNPSSYHPPAFPYAWRSSSNTPYDLDRYTRSRNQDIDTATPITVDVVYTIQRPPVFNRNIALSHCYYQHVDPQITIVVGRATTAPFMNKPSSTSIVTHQNNRYARNGYIMQDSQDAYRMMSYPYQQNYQLRQYRGSQERKSSENVEHGRNLPLFYLLAPPFDPSFNDGFGPPTSMIGSTQSAAESATFTGNPSATTSMKPTVTSSVTPDIPHMTSTKSTAVSVASTGPASIGMGASNGQATTVTKKKMKQNNGSVPPSPLPPPAATAHATSTQLTAVSGISTDTSELTAPPDVSIALHCGVEMVTAGVMRRCVCSR